MQTETTGSGPVAETVGASSETPGARHGFARRPEPRSIGDAGRGRLILSGHLPLAVGWLAGDPFTQIPGGEADAAALHGFGWLDDLAAVGTALARGLAQARVLGWVRRNPHVPPAPDLAGPEWRADVTGRRVLRWVFHGGMLLPGLDRAAAAPVFASLHDQIAYLERHAGSAVAGLSRLEALAGLAIGALSLRGAGDRAAPALDALGAAATTLAEAPAPSVARNPEALLDAAALLVWAREVAAEAGVQAPASLATALDALLPVLRSLRHADGGLPRAHGGGPGAPGRLDHVLTAAPGAPRGAQGLALGFARMARGRTTAIFDAAPPPRQGHASSLGLEVTVARSPLIVSCGAGAGFGEDWAAAARATACASTLTLDDLSSARLDAPARAAGLIPPRTVWAGGCDRDGRVTPPDCGPEHGGEVAHLLSGHDGWRDSHGLTHLRELWLEPDGLALRGEDSLAAVDQAARDRLSRIRGHDAMPVTLHFHLHPDVAPRAEADAVSLTLPGGELWRFRHDGTAALALAPSVWFDPAAAAPRPTLQITLSAPLGGFARQIGWRLAREG